MKKLILCFFCCICLISCKSTVHLPIPGESTIKQNNIYSEYMSIGDAYLDLEKFDKAITIMVIGVAALIVIILIYFIGAIEAMLEENGR